MSEALTFAQIMGSLVEAEGGFSTRIGADWAQGRTVFGGMLGALGNEAMRRVVDEGRTLRSFQATFAGPVAPGDVLLRARLLRTGRAVSVVQGEILQAEQLAVTFVGIYGLPRESGVLMQREPHPLVRSADELSDMRHVEGVSPVFMQNFVLRWAQGQRPFGGSDKADSQVLLRHRDATQESRRALDESRLLALVDCVPSPALGVMRTRAPISTLTWTVDFTGANVAGNPLEWWQVDSEVIAAGEGYVSQNSEIVNPDGKIAALSHQLVAVYA